MCTDLAIYADASISAHCQVYPLSTLDVYHADCKHTKCGCCNPVGLRLLILTALHVTGDVWQPTVSITMTACAQPCRQELQHASASTRGEALLMRAMQTDLRLHQWLVLPALNIHVRLSQWQHGSRNASRVVFATHTSGWVLFLVISTSSSKR